MSQNIDNRFMEFRLSDQLYALPLLSIKEVIRKPEITIIPNMPPHFEGIMNLRGQILGVFNIRKKISAKPNEAKNPKDVVVVIERNGIFVGILVDEVTTVLHPEADNIRPAPLKEGDPAQPYVKFVIHTEKDLVMAIDMPTLLDLDKYKLADKVS